jgi:spermidine synthase
MTNDGKAGWIPETLFDRLGFRMIYEPGRMLHEINTLHQHLQLFEHKFFGKVLVLDGAVQITSLDEFIYQEMMSHVPLFAHGQPENVLIVGGGDCGIAAQVLKHRSVKRLVQVEIDASVVEFSKEFFPEFTGVAFNDDRFESVIDDGARYVAEADTEFDVIIVDSTDPQGPGKVLFSHDFYEACRRCMSHNSVLVTQNGVPFLQREELVSSVGSFRKIFKHSGCYIAAVPTYVGGHMAMGWASNIKLPDITPDVLLCRYVEAEKFDTKYWTPQVQHAAFALPRFIRDLIHDL